MAFGRFNDEWVQEKVLFDFVMNNGGCSCCGVCHSDLQKNYISSCSDLDTVEAANENEECIWPPEIKTSIWADRVAIRKEMKSRKVEYKALLAQQGNAFRNWYTGLALESKRNCFAMSASDFKSCFTKFNIAGPFSILLCTVLEQIKNFPETKYAADANSACELSFELGLRLEKDELKLSSEYIQLEINGALDYFEEFSANRSLFKLPVRKDDEEVSYDFVLIQLK